MASVSCGIDALTLGSLMMLAPALSRQSSPSAASVSGSRCSSVRFSGNEEMILERKRDASKRR